MIFLFLGRLLFSECLYATCKDFVPSVCSYLSFRQICPNSQIFRQIVVQIRALIAYVLDQKLGRKKKISVAVSSQVVLFEKVFGSFIPSLFLTFQKTFRTELIFCNKPIKKLSALAKLLSWVLTVNDTKCSWICPLYLGSLTLPIPLQCPLDRDASIKRIQLCAALGPTI